MCVEVKDPKMTGLHEKHLITLQEAVPKLKDVTADLYSALTADINPHLPTLTSLIAMVEALRNEDYGVLGEHRLVRMPLSIIGQDLVRYRPPIVTMLHESILSLRMSDITIENIDKALKPHELCILFLCSCGVVMGHCDDVHAFYGSDDHRRMDRLRSAIDAAGSAVREIASFDDIRVPTMDMHENGSERRMFYRISELTTLAAGAGYAIYDWLDQEFQHFLEKTKSVLVVS